MILCKAVRKRGETRFQTLLHLGCSGKDISLQCRKMIIANEDFCNHTYLIEHRTAHQKTLTYNFDSKVAQKLWRSTIREINVPEPPRVHS